MSLVGLKRSVRRLQRGLWALNPWRRQREVDALFGLLYDRTHDLEQALDLGSKQTRDAFAHQWETHKEGKYLLTDPWFRDNVTRILAEEELQLKPEWFAGKEVLDGGCGNGRWSYGLAKLGAHVTAVDVNPVAIEETRQALAGMAAEFHVTPLERLSEVFPEKRFDLVFSWGVAHHCGSFNQALRELIKLVKPDGVLYLYLYGRESLSYADDVALFKERVIYNQLPTEQERYAFLLAKAGGDPKGVHNQHDVYAPLINRRLDYAYVEAFLRDAGFEEVTRTLAHSELFIRAIKGNAKDYHERWITPPKQAPFWFEHHGTHA